jgi:hypothetical protein
MLAKTSTIQEFTVSFTSSFYIAGISNLGVSQPNSRFDRNGVQNIYKTKDNGKEIYQPVHDDWDKKKGRYEDNNVGWIEERYKNRNYKSGGSSKGAQYQFTKTKDFVNQEVTVYAKI